MAEGKRKGTVIRAAERPEDWKFSHPFNEHSEMNGISLGDAAGLKRVGVHIVRVPPGKESAIYHTHHAEEEFYFILSGKGIAEVGDDEVEVGPGDFIGLPAPSVGHHLRNPFDEDLVYLAGGERREIEFAEFPRIGKKLIRVGREAHVVDDDDMKLFWHGKR